MKDVMVFGKSIYFLDRHDIIEMIAQNFDVPECAVDIGISRDGEIEAVIDGECWRED